MAIYKVKKGDTLWKIAQQNNTSVADLVKTNNIVNPDMINIGQEIRLPSQAMPKNSPIDHDQAYLDTFKDIQDSRKTLSKPKAPITNTADYQAMLDTYRDIPDNSPPLATGIKQQSNVQADYQAMLDTYKDIPDNSPQIVTGINKQQSQNQSYAEGAEITQNTQNIQSKASDPYTLAVQNYLQNQQVQAPSYSSPYSDQINSLINQVVNRDKFNYNINEDPVYNALRDQYTNLGNLAMRDAMGNAAQLTGGYGNTYASQVGNQAYRQYLSGLGEKTTDLYQNAYDNYTAEGNEIYKQLNSLGSLEDLEYKKYLNALDQYNTDRSFSYKIEQDQLDRKTYEEEKEYQRTMDLLNAAAKSSGEPIESMSYTDVNKMVSDAYNKGATPEYIANTVYNTYRDIESFWEDDGLAWTLMLPDGTLLADYLYELIKGKSSGTHASTESKGNNYTR